MPFSLTVRGEVHTLSMDADGKTYLTLGEDVGRWYADLVPLFRETNEAFIEREDINIRAELEPAEGYIRLTGTYHGVQRRHH